MIKNTNKFITKQMLREDAELLPKLSAIYSKEKGVTVGQSETISLAIRKEVARYERLHKRKQSAN